MQTLKFLIIIFIILLRATTTNAGGVAMYIRVMTTEKKLACYRIG